MKRCLCCGQNLNDETIQWHQSCVKHFFGSSTLPTIDLKTSETGEIIGLFDEKSSVPGVQRKLSLGLSSDKKRLTLVNFPYGYIIKPEIGEIKEIARSEQLVMSLADTVGIRTALHGLLVDKDGTYIFITKRLDRDGNKKIHMEDMCQLSNKITDQKYDGSYEYLGKLIYKYTNSVADVVEYFYRLLFCFIVGNSDMHLKNFSLIEEEHTYLSPAYDLLPVNLIYPKDTEETALTLNGKKRNITKKDFYTLGQNIGLNEKVITNLIKRLSSFKEKMEIQIKESLLSNDLKDSFIKLLNIRLAMIQ